MEPHREQLMRLGIVTLICCVGLIASMVRVNRIHRMFKQDILYPATTRQKVIVMVWTAGIIFCAGGIAVLAP